ncbi:MAG: hypothetical protein JNJ83_06745 [Verrucomicrobiaceae bacterium]|nr:hypothetical protein [Verrucomicrobiaceae bacterium]
MNTQNKLLPGDWLPDLFAAGDVAANAQLPEIQARMDDLAMKAAPLARSWSRWMTAIQALAVMGPCLWMVRRAVGLSPWVAALLTLTTVLILIGALWWMRWKGMQRTWARARLVAEVARSQMTASIFPVLPARHVLDAVPALRPIVEIHDEAHEQPWPQWKDIWLKSRVDDQIAYYKKAKQRAEDSRKHFTKWATVFMDVMLALAAAGVILTVSSRAPQWLRMLGDYRMEAFLGAVGMMLPLGIVLIQSLRYLQELNRRTARFARQISMLEKARADLLAAPSQEVALQIVSATEDQLLGEVVDWYFEAETAEQFYQVRESAQPQRQSQEKINERSTASKWAWAAGGAGLLFLGRVVLGRMPFVIAASAATLGWLSFSAPSDPEARSKLKAEGSLVDETGKPWIPDPELAPNGTIIIAHGLHDGAITTGDGTDSPWMREMRVALIKRLGDKSPNIGLVDWAAAAMPGKAHKIDPGNEVGKFLADLAGIPSQAREIGDLLAFRLAQMIWNKQIDTTKPLHLIGHSAGGFVVSRAALRLKMMNLAPATMHVTILDTPAPDNELTVQVPQACSSMDFYVTSQFVIGLDDNAPPEGIHLKHITPPPGGSLLDAHSYAYKWYTAGIPAAKPEETGFGRSPFSTVQP